MDIPELGEKTVPNMIAARIPAEMKPELIQLMALEKRKLNNLFMLLLKEGIPLKRKVHEQKSMLIETILPAGHQLSFSRSPLIDNQDYKDSPGLLMEVKHGVHMIPFQVKITKENALTLAANLSIFLNEVNL